MIGFNNGTLRPSAIPAWDIDRVRRRVSVYAGRDQWTAEQSLALVEAILSGRGGLDRAAEKIGKTRDECLAQWKILMPEVYRGGIDNQAKLLAALREAVKAAVPA